jgi:hypothetical protein
MFNDTENDHQSKPTDNDREIYAKFEHEIIRLVHYFLMSHFNFQSILFYVC